MRLNNKGFAITAVLYGLLILFVILVSSYLLVLSAKKDRIDNLVSEIEGEYRGEGETENPSSINLKEYLTDLYNNADKTEVTNNGIVYNYASAVGLMNDRLGGTTSDYNVGNIRYYGENPDNYIYFNCSDYSNQTDSTCEKWRIIGIVDGKVKLIRNESIGFYAYDYTSVGEYDNNWSDATLNTLLNSTYYNSGSIIYYSYEDGTTVSFSSNGITETTRNNNLISDSTWFINAMSDLDIYANTSYIGERTGDSTWLGKIALAYPSDYGYSADLNSCTNTIYNYEDENCTSVNWLTSMFTIDSYYWLIISYSDLSDQVWYVDSGFVNSNDGNSVYEKGGVLPVLYLDENVVINGKRDGTRDNPYRIVVK